MDIIFIIQKTMLFAIPLMLVALGGVFAERSGIINLALEGEMIFGALVGAILSRVLIESGAFAANSQWLFIICMIVSALGGALFSLLLSFSAIKLKADQTISGTALNLMAPAIVCTFGLVIFNSEKVVSTANFVLIQSNYSEAFQSMFTSPVGWLFELIFDKMYISTYIAIFVFIILSIWLYFSKVGTHLRACGEHPQAADSVGINVYAMRYLGTTISGALAGLGGYIFIVTCAASTASSSVAGLGFLGLAIMIFGNWNPVLIFLGSILFGFLKCLGVLYVDIPFLAALNIPRYVYYMIPYIVVLIVLAVSRNKMAAPKAEGIPYDKGAR